MRPRILRLMAQSLNGTIEKSELTPDFQKFLVPRQQRVAAYFGRFGSPRKEIFKGKYDDKQTTLYLYRIEFASAVRDFSIRIDKKTNLVSSIGIQPPS
jgi:hypothetical protein